MQPLLKIENDWELARKWEREQIVIWFKGDSTLKLPIHSHEATTPAYYADIYCQWKKKRFPQYFTCARYVDRLKANIVLKCYFMADIFYIHAYWLPVYDYYYYQTLMCLCVSMVCWVYKTFEIETIPNWRNLIRLRMTAKSK